MMRIVSKDINKDSYTDSLGSDILVKALELLLAYPLCDNCLGRMFALMGRGLSNYERGRSIKTLLVMRLSRNIREGDKESIDLFRRLAPNMGEIASVMYKELFDEELESRECFICGSSFRDIINTAAQRAINILREMDLKTFLIAAKVEQPVKFREDELKRKYRLVYAESIGSELKREVSKLIQKEVGLTPNFERPDTIIEITIPTATIKIRLMPLFLKGLYWKLGRRVSQSLWVSWRGRRRYPFSVEESLFILSRLFNSRTSILHASGREDVDARMLGTGRPFIAEFKSPLRRYIDLPTLTEELNNYSNGLVKVFFTGVASRGDIRFVKEEVGKRTKLYKALISVSNSIDKDSLRELEEFYRDRRIKQRTPRRVRHRRIDTIRHRIVHAVSTRLITDKLFESLIHADAGLYVKELIDGDNGDTTPSFSEVLGVEAKCIELDVLGVL